MGETEWGLINCFLTLRVPLLIEFLQDRSIRTSLTFIITFFFSLLRNFSCHPFLAFDFC